MTGAIPVFLTPTRNNFGIIGPIPRSEFEPENIQQEDPGESVRARSVGEKPEPQAAHPDHHAEHLRRRDLQRRDDQGHARRLARYAALRRSLAAARRVPRVLSGHARDRRGPSAHRSALVFATHSTHKLLAGISQASQIVVQDSKNSRFDKHRFNEAYLMHTSTSPQYAIIASCDVAAAMMEAPGGTALVEESIAEALDFRRAMRKVDDEYGDDWFFKVWGPETFAEEGIGSREDWMLRAERRVARLRRRSPKASTCSTRSRRPSSRRVWTWTASFGEIGHSGCDRHEVSGRARHHRREDRPVFVLHHVHDRHHQGPLELDGHRTAAVQGRLRQQPAAVARAARIRRASSDVRTHRSARSVPADSQRLPRERHRAPDDRDVPVEHGAGDEAVGCVRQARAPRDRPGSRSTNSKAASRRSC